LRTWFAATKTREKDFADLVKVAPGTVRKWRYGQRLPRHRHMAAIAAITEGQVTPGDFVAQSMTKN